MPFEASVWAIRKLVNSTVGLLRVFLWIVWKSRTGETREQNGTDNEVGEKIEHRGAAKSKGEQYHDHLETPVHCSSYAEEEQCRKRSGERCKNATDPRKLQRRMTDRAVQVVRTNEY